MGLRPADLGWRPGAGPFGDPSGAGALSVRWLGTAGYELTYQGSTLLIDPYLTRVGLLRFLTQPVGPDLEAIARYIDGADGILVGHSHFDHAMDVPAIARRTGATVYGSQSTANLCLASGVVAGQVHALATTGEVFEVGSFRVRAVPSEHSCFMFGRVPYPGQIPWTCDLPLRARHYRCGQVFSFYVEAGGVTLYHAGSANLIDDAVRLREVDLLMMCIAGRQATERYVERIIRQTQPNRVLPMHYDNFFRPLEAPMALLPRTRFGRLVDDVMSVDAKLDVATLELDQRIDLRASG